MAAHRAAVEETSQTANPFRRPVPNSKLPSIGLKVEMNASIAMSLMRPCRASDFRSADEMFPERRKRAKHAMMAADVLKMSEETKYAEKSSPRPLNSATYLDNVWESPKSEISWMREEMRVSTVRVPISAWVIALARKAIPRAPVSMERMLRIVK